MKKRFSIISLILLLLCVVGSCSFRDSPEARNSSYFIKYFGESGDQTGADILVASDGGFYILGSSEIRNSETGALVESDIVLIRTDELGNQLWSQTYQDPDQNTSAVKMDFTEEGNIAIVGQIEQGTKSAIFILVVSPDGEELGLKREYGINYNYRASWIDAYEGGIVVSGTTDSVPLQATGPYLFSFNVNSTTLDPIPLWTTRNGKLDDIDSGVAVIHRQKLSNGSDEFLFYMNTNADDAFSGGQNLAGFNFFAFRSVNGTISSGASFFGNTSNQYAKAIAITAAGNIYIVGNTDAGTIGFAKADRDNRQLEPYWEGSGGSNMLKVRRATAFGEDGVTIIGEEINGTVKDIYLARFRNGSASPVWERRFGFPEFVDLGGGVVELDDGSIVFTGAIRLDNQYKICLIKVKADGSMQP